MKVMAQIAMVMNLDKCIGCHTCSVTCKQAWTNREGTEYIWFNNVETRPGVGYPRGWEDQDKWEGGWTRTSSGKLKPRAGGRLSKLCQAPGFVEGLEIGELSQQRPQPPTVSELHQACDSQSGSEAEQSCTTRPTAL